ncbi:MAG: spermidine synthase [Frankiales bacterium]|nr:spermidine synthase [Frankiales bacterium]
MSRRFAELDWQPTPIGDISLRRRLEPTLKVAVYEVLLGEEYLMSSLFTVAEEELARLALAELDGDALDVVVGGLGLGWTARTVLADPRVRALDVVEALEPVISWHQRGLLPGATEMAADPRCRFVLGDFFALAAQGDALGPRAPERCDAILLDVDHTPRHVLHPSHAPFYTPDGLRRLAGRLVPGGVFGLWSDDPPDPAFEAVLCQVFARSRSHVVSFANPLTGGESTNTVYVAVTG